MNILLLHFTKEWSYHVMRQYTTVGYATLQRLKTIRNYIPLNKFPCCNWTITFSGYNRVVVESCTIRLLIWKKQQQCSLRKKCPYLELFWSAFSRIRTEYGKMWTRITLNTDTFHAVLVITRQWECELCSIPCSYPNKFKVSVKKFLSLCFLTDN